MPKPLQKIVSLLLALGLLQSAVPAHAANFFEAPAVTATPAAAAFQTEAVNFPSVWYRAIRGFLSSQQRAKVIHEIHGDGLSNPALSTMIDGADGARKTFAEITAERLKDDGFKTLLRSTLATLARHNTVLHERLEGIPFSFYNLNEKMETRVMNGETVGVALISFPGLEGKELGKILGNPGLADQLKEDLAKQITKDTGFETAITGWDIYVSGINSEQISKLIYPIVEKLMNARINGLWDRQDARNPLWKLLYAYQTKKAAEGFQQFKSKFNASHDPIYFSRSDRPIADIEGELDKLNALMAKFELTPAQYEASGLAQRRDYVELMDSWRRQQRELWAQAGYYWALEMHKENPNPEARSNASDYAEKLINERMLNLVERNTVLRKATPPLLETVREAAAEVRKTNGISSFIPVLDDETVQLIKKKLTILSNNPYTAGDPNDQRWLFYQAIMIGRYSAVPSNNYSTGKNPRLLHVLEAKALTRLETATDKLLKAEEPTQDQIDLVKTLALDYQSQFAQALVYAYRLPRYTPLYRQDIVAEVADAQDSGRWLTLKNHFLSLINQWNEAPEGVRRQRPREPGLLESAALLIQTMGTLVFKRDKGDEIEVALRKAGGYQIAMIELNKFNAFQQKFPPDARDRFQHRLQEMLIKILQSQHWDDLHEPLELWQSQVKQMISDIGGGEFQMTEKVQGTKEKERMPLFIYKDPKSGKETRYARGSDRTYYVYGGWWRKSYRLVTISDEIKLGMEKNPILTELSASVIIQKQLVQASELKDSFDLLSEPVMNFLKLRYPSWKEIVVYYDRATKLLTNKRPAKIHPPHLESRAA